MKIQYIELLGQKHPMCFSVAAATEMDEAFGGVEELGTRLQEGTLSQKLQTVVKALQILMNAGRIYVSASGGKLPDEIPINLADLIDVTDNTVAPLILSVIAGDVQREVETVSKNGEAAQNL